MLAARASEQIRGNGHLIKRLNKSRILECLQQGESLSRVELAERTGISVVGFDVGTTKITGGIPDLEGNDPRHRHHPHALTKLLVPKRSATS